MVIEGIGFPKSHDLDDLRDRLPPVWHAATAFPDLAGLTDWAVGSRYPGTHAQPPTTGDATTAVDLATRIVRSIKADFDQRSKALERPEAPRRSKPVTDR